MRRDSKTTNRATAEKPRALRLLALVACVLIIAVLLFPEAFILTHVNHEHDHHGANGACATCAQLAATVHLLNQLSTAVVKTAAILFSLFAILTLPRFIIGFVRRSSLVALKVQLNN